MQLRFGMGHDAPSSVPCRALTAASRRRGAAASCARSRSDLARLRYDSRAISGRSRVVPPPFAGPVFGRRERSRHDGGRLDNPIAAAGAHRAPEPHHRGDRRRERAAARVRRSSRTCPTRGAASGPTADLEPGARLEPAGQLRPPRGGPRGGGARRVGRRGRGPCGAPDGPLRPAVEGRLVGLRAAPARARARSRGREAHSPSRGTGPRPRRPC